MTSLDDDSKDDSTEIMGDLLTELSGEGSSGGSGSGLGKDFGSGEEEGSEDDEDLIEFVEVSKDWIFIAYLMRIMAIMHSIISLAMLVAYYHLKVRHSLAISFF